jgi:arabinogalactan oligomer/maltooligosaccharide transport system substrate-binding protein
MFLTGCASGDTLPDQSAAAESSSAAVLEIWVDQELTDVATVVAEQFLVDTGAQVNVVEKRFSDIRSELQVSVPDLFVGSHEWTDELAQAGQIAKLDASLNADMSRAASLGFQYRGESYGIPYAIESLALICDESRVATQPASLTDLNDIGFKIALSPGSDPYTLFTLQSSFDVMPLAVDEFGDWAPGTGFNNPNSKLFTDWLESERDAFTELDYGSAIEAVLSGNQPCLLSGPWALGSLQTDTFTPKVFEFPAVGDFPARSFSTIKGLFLSSGSQNPEQAKLLASYFADSSTQQLIQLQTGRIPVENSVIATVEDSAIQGFANAAKNSIPLPASSMMQQVWAPWGLTLRSILFDGADPTESWSSMLTKLAEASK